MSTYPAFLSYPATGPVTSPLRFTPQAAEGGSLRVTLSGSAFSVRVQISNAQALTGAAHLFLPPEASWETKATVMAPDLPVDVPGPVRWVRLVVDLGSVTGGNIEENPTRNNDVGSVEAGRLAGAAAGAAAGQATAALLNAQIASGTLTPEMYGAVGDGVADDKAALWALCADYRAGIGSRIVISRPHRIGRGTTAAHVAGALEFVGVPRVHIEFVGKGELLMDNLGDDGGGHEYGAIYLAGPSEEIILTRPRIRWKTRPGPLSAGGFTARGQGDGIMVRGYPGDTGSYEGIGLIKKVTVDTPYVKWAPQTGMIFMGVSDPHVINAKVVETGADSCHFNACRRPRVSGGVQAIGCGDDALPFVTYYGPDRTPIYPGTGAALYRVPWFINSQTDEWSNGGGYADKVECIGGSANACRMDAAYNCTVEVVHAVNTPFALQIDAVKANPALGLIWNGAASKGARVGRVIADGCYAPVLVIAQNVAKTDPGAAAYYDMDVEIGSIQAKRTTGPWAVRVTGAENVRFGSINTDGNVLFNGGAKIIRAGLIKGTGNLVMDMAADVVLTHVDVIGGITATNSIDIRGGLWESSNSQTNGAYFAGINKLHLDTLIVYYPNRSNAAGNRGVLFAPAQNVRIGTTAIYHDANELVALEIGGGSAAGRSDQVDLGTITYTHNKPYNNGDTSLQAGPYAATKLRFNLLSSNDGGASYLRRTVDTWTDTRIINNDGDRVIAWGDSRTEGPDGVSGYVNQLPALIGRPVLNMGIAGQTSAQIAARSGAGTSSFTLPGGNIPGNGGAIVVNLASGPDLLHSGVARRIMGLLNGRHGRLEGDGAGGYGFYPDPTGTETPTSGNQPFVPDNPYRAYIHIIWMGRNDDLVGGIAALKANVAAMVARIYFPGRYIVMGELNGQTEPNGSAVCESIKTYNSQQLGTYGAANFLDPRGVLCVNADGSPRPDGTPNPLWMVDAIHPNATGYARLAAAHAAKFAANGW